MRLPRGRWRRTPVVLGLEPLPVDRDQHAARAQQLAPAPQRGRSVAQRPQQIAGDDRIQAPARERRVRRVGLEEGRRVRMALELRARLREHAGGEVDAGDVEAVGREEQGDVAAAGAEVEHLARAGRQRGAEGPRPGLALAGQGESGQLVLVVLSGPAGPVAVPGLLVLGGGAGHRGGSRGDRGGGGARGTGAEGASGWNGGGVTGPTSQPWPSSAASSGPRKRNWVVPSAARARSAATA